MDEGATLLGYLREWRDHMSKMNRCETVDIVSDAALEQIVNSGACSVLEIDSAIIHTQGKGIPVDRLTRMMGVIKLFKQTMGNKTV